MIQLFRKSAVCSLIVTLLFILSSCEGNEDSIVSDEMEITIESESQEILLTFYQLSSDFVEIQNKADWITIIQNPNTDGKPCITISCTKNNEFSIRKAIIILRTGRGDRITITIIQNYNTVLDGVHNDVSDQPALVPIRK